MSVEESEAAAEARPEKESGHGLDYFELFSTILLALAAIATAWAGFQAAKWGGIQASNTSQSAGARAESVRASTTAGQQTSIDVTTFFNWLDAVVGDIDRDKISRPKDSADYQPAAGTLSGFIFERFRDEFKPAVRAWLDTSPFESNDGPPTPFKMPEYRLASDEVARELLAESEEKAEIASQANQNGDNYVISAVLFASSLFFAALASKLVGRRYRTAAIIVAALVYLGTLIYILTLPLQL
jgi:hypothetical protein